MRQVIILITRCRCTLGETVAFTQQLKAVYTYPRAADAVLESTSNLCTVEEQCNYEVTNEYGTGQREQQGKNGIKGGKGKPGASILAQT